MFHRSGFIAILAAALAGEGGIASSADSPRTTRDLQALYVFESVVGDVVRDRSGVGNPLDLKIEQPNAVRREPGRLVVRASVRIASQAPARKIIDACKRSNELTVEAWIRPANARQDGPARIVSLSRDTSRRNFTLGQEADRFDARLRAASTSANGLPSLATSGKSLQTEITHVVYTRDRSGNATIYLNGEQRSSKKVGGSLSSWSNDHRLILANELTGDRPWLGELRLAAIYSRALTIDEVRRNFNAGEQALVSPEALAQRRREALARSFETKIAPLLAKRCVECHDSATRKGGLDLSRKLSALAGSENGKVILPGNSTGSPLWKLIEAGKMPRQRSPLTSVEKTLLRQWIDSGAVWSLDFIDPAVYAAHGGDGQVWIQRLTVDEYVETVRVAVGVDVVKDARRLLPPDLRADGFSNTAYNLNVDLKHVSAYAQLAEIIVGRMDVDEFAKRFSRGRRLTDKDNRDLIAKMGQWVLRGPLEEREIVAYRGVATTAASSGADFREAMGYVLESMLQSPRFIYRIERQQGGGVQPVGPHELASRLSYVIWGGPPDEELFKAAQDGKLNRGTTAAHADRMLTDPRAARKSLHFVSEWLNLGRLNDLQPSRERFPDWDPKLGEDMRRETLMFAKEVLWNQNRPLGDLFNADFTFATPRLARHYGLTIQPGDREEVPARYDLTRRPERGGLLTQGSVLTVGGDEASMVSRGLFVLHDLLRGVVNDPPPGVDTTPVPSKAGVTQRGVAENRVANVHCGGCHARFEPLAFGLEKFDGLGAFRESDRHGNRLREDGVIRIPGEARPISYKSSAEL
ncbi:MAG: DUF1592 domain-containing protein, partial [Planctomycetales bacterium]